MRRLLAGLLVLLAAGCQHAGPLLTECNGGTFTIAVTLYDSDDALNEALRVYEGALYSGPAYAWGTKTNPIQLHLPKLRGQDDAFNQRVWGHELAHVACGDWHDDPALAAAPAARMMQ